MSESAEGALSFTPTPLPGVHIVTPRRHEDERGFFARTWCATEFGRRGLATTLSQSSVSFNTHKGTIRGMHLQAAPHAEIKLVRCTRGAIYDVVVDLRPDSPTFTKWTGVELSSSQHTMIYIPEGCAHGFQTLQEASEVLYLMSGVYVPAASLGVRWNDPLFKIDWPAPPSVISDRDRNYPDFAQ